MQIEWTVTPSDGWDEIVSRFLIAVNTADILILCVLQNKSPHDTSRHHFTLRGGLFHGAECLGGEGEGRR